MSNITTSTLSAEYQNLFSKDLLYYAVQDLALAEYGKKAKLPKNMGHKAITFFRFDAPDVTNVQSLSEGVAISTFRDLTLSTVAVTLAQYGEAARMTDILTMTELFDSLEQNIKVMGEEAALKLDTVTRNELVTNATQERFAQSTASFAGLSAASASDGAATRQDFLGCATRLKISRAKTFGSNYICIIPPQVSHDLRKDADWLEAAKYSNVQALYKGEIGMLDGIRFVEATNPFIEANSAEDTYDAAGTIYSSLVLGQEAFGIPELAGQSPFSPSIIIVDTPDSANPLNQYKTVGWKAFWAAKMLNGNYFVNLRSKTTFA